MSTVVARASRLLTGRGPKPADSAAILGALPVPVLLLDAENRFRHVNHAAEQFLGMSAAGLTQLRLEDLLPQDNPLFLLIEQVRQTEATISDHDLNLESPRLHKRGITVQGSPLPEEPGAVLLVMQDASAARALDRQLAFRGAARSVTGMADAESDPMYDQAVEVVLKHRRASISLVQRHLRIGYNRAARLLEQMENAGMVSAMQSNGNREILAPNTPREE